MQQPVHCTDRTFISKLSKSTIFFTVIRPDRPGRTEVKKYTVFTSPLIDGYFLQLNVMEFVKSLTTFLCFMNGYMLVYCLVYRDMESNPADRQTRRSHTRKIIFIRKSVTLIAVDI